MFKKNRTLAPNNNVNTLTRSELKLVSAENIRKFRDEKCYTQSYIASQLGIGQSAYQKIESGDVKISMERLIQIANILGKPIDAFIPENNNQSENVKTVQKIQIAKTEYDLIHKIIIQQEKRIEELEIKLAKRDDEIEKLKKPIEIS
ncbi:XRE family transcriptional regulator [Pedobacter psychrodurus]|uniref:XRE family transcriptional regulator n=1 Tax=Pedobacter psychrodurus TaxID=2530456 RepID=A0A4R0PZA8_9SPHI|nr:helix-turn-helix transcriptional regulator [Pedobacter psychrodurus]TCD27788.1 XRE family transcriptional regulator [Pedobacter psychrodurus]